MRIEIIAGAAALLASGVIQGRPPLLNSVPYEHGVYRVEAEVIGSGEGNGVLRVGEQTVRVTGDVPPAGTVAEMRLRYSPDGHRLESSGRPLVRTPYDLGDGLVNSPSSGSYRVVGELRPAGIRVGRNFIAAEHDLPPGQWVHARVNTNNQSLSVLEELEWNGRSLAGYPSRSNRPTHTENGQWVN